MDGVAVDRLRIAHGMGDLAVMHAGQDLGHGGSVVLERGGRVEGEHRREALRDAACGDDRHGEVGGCGGRLCSHDDVAVVGQHDDLLGTCLLGGSKDVGGGGVHGLAALDDDVDAQGTQDFGLAGTGSHGDDAKWLDRGLGSLVLSDLLSALVGLHIHVMNEDIEDLTDGEHVVEHMVGAVGVNMNLVVGVRTNKKLAVTLRGKEITRGILIEGLLGLEEKLRAVAELRALPVVVELDGNLGVGLSHGLVCSRGDPALATERVGAESLKEDGKAKRARVDDAVLLENGKQVGRARDALESLGHQGVERLLEGRMLLLAHVGTLGDVAQHGEDGALNRLAHGGKGHLDGTAER